MSSPHHDDDRNIASHCRRYPHARHAPTIAVAVANMMIDVGSGLTPSGLTLNSMNGPPKLTSLCVSNSKHDPARDHPRQGPTKTWAPTRPWGEEIDDATGALRRRREHRRLVRCGKRVHKKRHGRVHRRIEIPRCERDRDRHRGLPVDQRLDYRADVAPWVIEVIYEEFHTKRAGGGGNGGPVAEFRQVPDGDRLEPRRCDRSGYTSRGPCPERSQKRDSQTNLPAPRFRTSKTRRARLQQPTSASLLHPNWATLDALKIAVRQHLRCPSRSSPRPLPHYLPRKIVK